MKHYALTLTLILCAIAITMVHSQTITLRDNGPATATEVIRQSFLGIRGLAPVREVASTTELLNPPTGYALLQYNSDDSKLYIKLGTATGTVETYSLTAE
jgi:hypothetical protein